VSTRWALVASGAVLMLAGLFIAPLRALLITGGIVLLLVGVCGNRLGEAYRGTAIVLLNTLLVVVTLEVLAGAALTVGTSDPVRDVVMRVAKMPNDLIRHHYLTIPYYERHEWSAGYWREHGESLRKRYEPYVVWRSPSYNGDHLNIDDRGVRTTPGSTCAGGALKIYTFGGSAMWGWGAPDWGTIPAYLQQEVESPSRPSICVVNYGEQAFVSTQELIQLQLRLAAGDVPDVVLFYSGVNDVFAADQVGGPILHQNLQDIATRFDRTEPSLLRWLLARNAVRLGRMVSSQLGLMRGNRPQTMPEKSTAELADGIIDTYLRGYETVDALSERFGFRYAFFWQPHILAGDKPLTPEERDMPEGLGWVVTLSPRIVELFSRTYDRIAIEAAQHEHMYYLGDVFDETETQVWIDTWGHVTPEGNRLVAERMAASLQKSLAR
jgi:lysophospholipase L1-like esterase